MYNNIIIYYIIINIECARIPSFPRPSFLQILKAISGILVWSDRSEI